MCLTRLLRRAWSHIKGHVQNNINNKVDHLSNNLSFQMSWQLIPSQVQPINSANCGANSSSRIVLALPAQKAMLNINNFRRGKVMMEWCFMCMRENVKHPLLCCQIVTSQWCMIYKVYGGPLGNGMDDYGFVCQLEQVLLKEQFQEIMGYSTSMHNAMHLEQNEQQIF